MALFEEHHFGKPISEELSRYITKHTSTNDRADVARHTGVGTSTIRDTCYGASSVSKRNSVAIIEMMRKAVYNCTHKINTAMKAKSVLETHLRKEKQQKA